jgi:peptidoglycan/LPS O-acetylase OafA/YrhL
MRSDVGVDGFFALSGFLIVRSWQRSTPGRYVLARARRVLPGLAVCLLVVAFGFAPMVGSPVLRSQLSYVLSGLHFGEQWGIDGSLAAWNGSLWSIRYEVACYAVVAILGVLRLLRAPTALLCAVGLWAVTTELTISGISAPFSPVWLSLRCALMFSLGASAWMLRDRIRLDARLAVASAALLVASAFAPDYRMIGAVPLVYLLLWIGMTLGPRWTLFAVASAVAVAPFAAASWFVVERPAMRARPVSRPRGRDGIVAGKGTRRLVPDLADGGAAVTHDGVVISRGTPR